VREIAHRAGVSIGSVSTVLNNRQAERRISPLTAEKIRAMAAKLGYLPNIGARRLRSGDQSKNTIVLALVTSFEAPITLVKYFIVALQRAAAAGSDYSFSLLVEMFSAGHLREMPGLLTGDHFNAALIMNTTAADDAFLTRVHLPYPSVLVNRAIPGYASVVETATAGGRPAEIFFRSKRRRLAVLHGSPLTQITRARVDTFMQHAAQLTGNVPEEIVAANLSESASYKAIKKFFKRGGQCDGLYAVSDALALGAYRAIKECGLTIPRNIAVIGVGDYDIAPFFDPPLSCVGVSHRELAEQASALLLQQLARGAEPGRTLAVPLVEALRASSGHHAG